MVNSEGESATANLYFQETEPYDMHLNTDAVKLQIEVSGSHLFRGLQNIRQQLEKMGWKLVCNGSCEDVRPSGMSISMSGGRTAYVLRLGTVDPERTVDIFAVDYVSRIEQIVSVEEQNAYFGKWLNSRT